MELENCANSSASSISELKAQGYVEAIEIYRALEMRYFGQNYELEVFFPANDFDDHSVRDLWRRFHEQHNRRFGFCIPGEIIELVNLNVVAVSVLKRPELRELPEQPGISQLRGKRRVRFEEGWLETPVYDRDSFGQGCRIGGPAVVEEAASATVLCPGQNLSVDRFGNLLLSA